MLKKKYKLELFHVQMKLLLTAVKVQILRYNDTAVQVKVLYIKVTLS